MSAFDIGIIPEENMERLSSGDERSLLLMLRDGYGWPAASLAITPFVMQGDGSVSHLTPLGKLLASALYERNLNSVSTGEPHE